MRGGGRLVALTTPARPRPPAPRGGGLAGGLVMTWVLYLVVASTMGTLWRVAAHDHGGVLAGYTAAQLTWYLATSEAVTVSLNSRLIERIGDEIGAGVVATELLRPAS